MAMGRDNAQRPPSGLGWKLGTYAIFIALFGLSLPSLWRAYQVVTLGVAWSEVPFARQQQALWARNEMCASVAGDQARFPPAATPADTDRALREPRQIVAFTGMTVRLQACWNGDVLVRTVLRDRKGRAVWLPAEGFVLEEAGLGLAGAAMAQTRRPSEAGPNNATTFEVQCQAWPSGTTGSGRVVRVINVDNSCTRETINPPSGAVELAESVPCDAGCEPDQPE